MEEQRPSLGLGLIHLHPCLSYPRLCHLRPSEDDDRFTIAVTLKTCYAIKWWILDLSSARRSLNLSSAPDAVVSASTLFQVADLV